MLTTNHNTTPTTPAKLEQLSAVVADAEEALKRAQELYDREPTRAHAENLKEAKAELKLAQKWLARLRESTTEQARPSQDLAQLISAVLAHPETPLNFGVQRLGGVGDGKESRP